MLSCMHHACIVHVVSMCPVVVFSTKIEITFVQDDGCGPCVPAHASDATSTCIAGCSLHAFWLGDFAKRSTLRSAQNTTRERARTAASATPALPHKTLPRSCNVALWTTGTGAAGIPRIRAPAPQPDLKADPQPTSFAWSAP